MGEKINTKKPLSDVLTTGLPPQTNPIPQTVEEKNTVTITIYDADSSFYSTAPLISEADKKWLDPRKPLTVTSFNARCWGKTGMAKNPDTGEVYTTPMYSKDYERAVDIGKIVGGGADIRVYQEVWDGTCSDQIEEGEQIVKPSAPHAAYSVFYEDGVGGAIDASIPALAKHPKWVAKIVIMAARSDANPADSDPTAKGKRKGLGRRAGEAASSWFLKTVGENRKGVPLYGASTVTYSDAPMIDKMFIPFQSKPVGLEEQSKKGMNVSIIRTPEQGDMMIVNVHVHIGGKAEQNEAQAGQLDEIRALVEKARAAYPGLPVIVMGDFNVDALGNPDGYKKLEEKMGTSRLRDADVSAVKPDTYSDDNVYSKAVGIYSTLKQSLDHTFVSPEITVVGYEVKGIVDGQGVALSDHKASTMSFQVNNPVILSVDRPKLKDIF